MVLDKAALEELRLLDPNGTNGLFAKILNTYFVDAPALINKMGAALAAGDSSSLARHAHSLKSSSMSMGAMQLGGHARAIEAAANSKALEGCNALLDKLSTEYKAVETLLRAEITAPRKK